MDNVISLFEMYHDFFQSKKTWFPLNMIDMKRMADKLNIMHTYFTEVYAYFLSIKCKVIVGDCNATK